MLLSRGKEHLGGARRQGREGGVRAQTGFGRAVKAEPLLSHAAAAAAPRSSGRRRKQPQVSVRPAGTQRALLRRRGGEESSNDSFFTLYMIIWFWSHIAGGSSDLRAAFTSRN